MYYRITYILILLSLFSSCSNGNSERCNSLYEKALNHWLQYSLTDNTLCLEEAKQYLDSIDCKPVKRKVFELNLSVRYLLKDYEGGKKYVESFNSSDFAANYKKDMYIKAFEAAILESKGDTVNRNQLFKELINEIQLYLNKNPNEESLYDLFLVKRIIEDRNKILKEIEHIRSSKQYEDKVIDNIILMLTANNDENKTFTFN
jgi:lipoprotein